MANCFQLFRHGQSEPESLIKIDEEFCAHFNLPVHPKNWAYWYNSIGFLIAMGNDLHGESIEAKILDWSKDLNGKDNPEYLKDLNDALMWLREHFTSNAFVTVGK